MPREEMLRQFGDYTRKIMQEISLKKENFIQNHVSMIEKYNKEVVKGYSQIVANSGNANYDFSTKPLEIPKKIMKGSQGEGRKDDIVEKYK